ncbi:MAG: hypothetical protein JKY37_17300, partial [Nannocystaceae bacterium]|nr:hypothetical protein [Nannocystaceae bacterium]
MARAVEDLFPTDAMTQRMSSRGRFTEAAQYVRTHPSLDFRTTNVSAFVAENPPTDGTTRARLTAELRTAQRLFMVVPRFDRDVSAEVLLDAGIHSSQQIALIGRSAFVARHAQALGTDNVAVIYDNAEQITATVTTMLMRHASFMNQANPAAQSKKILGGNGGGGGEGMPDMATLLGSLDFCGCTHCQSVLSPAAYLVDLLRFIDNRPALGGLSAFQVLLEKRPDIVHVLLDCTNTNTPMPAIDMVNEILERAVVGEDPDSWPQTTRSAPELRAHPEHLSLAAYGVLADEVYPWKLPFHLTLCEAHAYLEHLGVPLWRVLSQLGGESLPEEAIAEARLALSPLE